MAVVNFMNTDLPVKEAIDCICGCGDVLPAGTKQELGGQGNIAASGVRQDVPATFKNLFPAQYDAMMKDFAERAKRPSAPPVGSHLSFDRHESRGA